VYMMMIHVNDITYKWRGKKTSSSYTKQKRGKNDF